MATSKPFVRSQTLAHQRVSAFSLVEVTLALGIMAFAFLPVLGLLPTGLNSFRQAMNTSVGSQIAQRVVNEVQQTDFDQLVTDASGTTIAGANNTGRKAIRYFDMQGDEVASAALAIYQVNTRVMPITVVPFGAGPGTPAEASDSHLATVTIQVAASPAGGTLALSTANPDDAGNATRNLWTGAYQSAPNNTSAAPMTTYSALVARNK